MVAMASEIFKLQVSNVPGSLFETRCLSRNPLERSLKEWNLVNAVVGILPVLSHPPVWKCLEELTNMQSPMRWCAILLENVACLIAI